MHNTKRKTTEQFQKEIKEKYGSKYDVSKAEYNGSHEKVCVICNRCGKEFWITPTNLLSGKGCPNCKKTPLAQEKRAQTNFTKFKAKANELHHNFYRYDESTYVNCKIPMRVICPIHGEFWVTPDKHLNAKQGCSKCQKDTMEKEKEERLAEKKLQKEFEEQQKKIDFENYKSAYYQKAAEKHNKKYSYHNDYVNQETKIRITCPVHGDFWQSPRNHLKGQGCPICARQSQTLTTETFIKRAKELYKDDYDYSKVEYKNAKTKVCVICPIHGDFWVTPNNHLNGKKCPYCAGKHKTTSIVIDEFKQVHGENYNYSKVDYEKSNKKVCIICPKHGEFWQTPNKHLLGHGCPLCNQSHLEETIYNWLINNGIRFLKNYRPKWLHGKELDFYLPKYNIAIECQGEQHFPTLIHTIRNNSIMSAESMQDLVKRDIAKNKECKEQNVALFYTIAHRVSQRRIINEQEYNAIYSVNNIINDLDNFAKIIFDEKIATR